MSEGMVQLVEVLSAAPARAEMRPIIAVTIRTHPDRSWTFQNLGLTVAQAERLRDDLSALLKTPAAFLVFAVLALATGCSAKVEVVNEKSAAVEAESAAPPVVAVEKSRTAVKVDLLGQQHAGPAVPKLPSVQSVATTEPMPSNSDGIQMNGNGNSIEFHSHRHRRSRSPGDLRLSLRCCGALLFITLTVRVMPAHEAVSGSPAVRNDQGFL